METHIKRALTHPCLYIVVANAESTMNMIIFAVYIEYWIIRKAFFTRKAFIYR